MLKSKKYTVFFDFDNTITTYDVIDDMVLCFSKDKRWIALEKQWREGRIGSKECLRGQMGGIRITKGDLDRYLNKIRLDAYFKRLLGLLKSRKVKVVVLSDNFGYILRRILANNGIDNLKIYSNRMKVIGDRIRAEFPFTNKDCPLCAHCKKNNLLTNVDKDSVIVYIGDGQSDICPAQCASIVFAKGPLLKYFQDNKLSCLPYKTLKKVYSYFKRSLPK